MFACCTAPMHQWEEHEVERRWLPATLKCFIVGENPGDTTSQYFYEKPSSYNSDGVVVRRALLRGLQQHGLVQEATLESFRDAGFLFDHAIRCQLSSSLVSAERQKATRYASPRVENPIHLGPWLSQAVVVWVMGHLASNAVANVTMEFPRQRRKISMPPFPAEVGPSSRLFLSEYITWRNETRVPDLCEAFKRFSRGRGVLVMDNLTLSDSLIVGGSSCLAGDSTDFECRSGRF